jgi:predicted dehydrogenase
LAITAEVLVELRDPGFRTGQTLPATSDLAVHAFDQVQLLVSAAPQEVHCVEVAMPFLGGHCALTSIVVTFADGSILAYRGGFAGPGLRTSANGLWRVDGAGMSASWDGGASRSGRVGDSAVPSYQACITAMLDAVQTGAAPTSSAVPLRSIAMLEAALTSAATGRRVTVAPVPGRQS